MPFYCNICEEESTQICARCTKDTCRNHLCEKCLRCSDCCECEIALEEPVREPARTVFRAAHADTYPAPNPDPDPEPPILPPDPDPLPPEDPEPGPIAP
jgi:hypothetical protein